LAENGRREADSPLMLNGSQDLRPAITGFLGGTAAAETVYRGDNGGALETEIQRSPFSAEFEGGRLRLPHYLAVARYSALMPMARMTSPI
jgi:hypothetical protein